MRKTANSALFVVIAATLGACTVQTSGGMQFGQPDAQQAVQIEYGKLLAAQVIRVPDQGATAATGAVTGALLGGALGNAIMHGKARKNGMLVGAGLGALTGASGAAAANNYKTVEYTVAKADGQNVLIDQNVPVAETPIAPGRRVMIQTSAGVVRVVPAVD
jgi:outer membrane lipoprotein SlyB